MKMSDDDSPILRRGGRNRGRAPVIAPSPDSQSQRPSKFAVPPPPDDPAFLPLPLSSNVPPSPVSSAVTPSVCSREHSSVEANVETSSSDYPSPVSSALTPSVCSRENSSVEARPARRASRRQLMLDNPFLDHQAKEGNEGSSVHGSSNSEDDQYCTHFLIISCACIVTNTPCCSDLPNESYVTDGEAPVLFLFWAPDIFPGQYSDGDKNFYLASLTSQAEELGFGTPLRDRRRREPFR